MNASQGFIDSLRERYPQLADVADAFYQRQGFKPVDAAYCIWVNGFSYAVNDRMNNYEFGLVKDVFEYIDDVNKKSNKEVQELIDVYFVENLFWQVHKEVSAEVWKLMPDALRELYLEFHYDAPI